MKSLARLSSALLLAVAFLVPSVIAQEFAIAEEYTASDAAPASLLESPAKLTLHRVSLERALGALYAQSGVRVAFSPSLLPTKIVSCDCGDVTVQTALDRILAGTDFRYTAVGEQVLVEPTPAPSIIRGDRRVMFASMGPQGDHAVSGATRNSATSASRAAPRVQEGTITGQVTDQAGNPLAGAQVFVQGTNIGALTDAEGRYRLANVPAGEATLRVQRIGFGTGERTVTVTSGETVAADFQLSETAIGLDEVVVTGSPAGEQRRRAIGTGIASIDVENTLANAPITSFNELLQGREAGVVSMAASGTAGTAGPMILRGITSLTQDNQPLIYIDGIRLDRSNTNLVGTGGQVIDRLSDINPQDISRMEVIKGAAATALYGSEASSGVIQIFTKRGQAGETQYSAGVRLGANRIPQNLPLMHPDPQYPSANDMLSTGLHQEYTASMRGGTDQFGYYVAGSHVDSEGSFVNNVFQRSGVRLNLEARPSERFTAGFTSSFNRSDIQLPPNDNWIDGILTTLYLGNPVTRGTESDPWGGAFIPVPLAMAREIYDRTNRFTGGVNLQHRLSPAFTHRVTVGVESVDGQGITFRPYWTEPGQADRPGTRSVNSRTNLQTNIDYSASFTQQLGENLEAQISAGSQFFTRSDHRVFATGTDFASPGLQSLGGTALASVNESDLSYTTGGLFAQGQFGYLDRIFLILGIRGDGSSAFGEAFGWQAFPKASLSYVISEEPWFQVPAISSLRLRGGWGTAGTQPGAFDAVRTFGNVVGMHGQPGIRAATFGNPDLAPEISHEFEAGFDLGFLGGRGNLEVTAYDQRTHDVLLGQRYPPSLGLLATQLTNVGQVHNRGFEISGNFALVERPGLRWGFNAGYAFNENEVVDLGDAPFMQIDRFGSRIVEGYPVSGKWERVTVGTDEEGFPIASDEVVYIGPSIPPHTGNLGTDLTVGTFTARAVGQFAAGHVVNNHLRPYMGFNRTGEEYWNEVIRHGNDPQHPEVLRFVERNRIFGDFIEDADWFKLREVSLSYGLPPRISGIMGARDATLTLAARNVLTLTSYTGTDPEMSATFGDGNNLSVGADFFSVPPAQQLMFGINVSF